MLRSYGGGRGYGTGVFESSGRRVVGHDGITHGFIGFLEHYVDDQVTIVFLGNIRTGVLGELRRALPAIVFEEPFEVMQPPVAVGASGDADLRRLIVGTYELFPGFYIEVSSRGGDLYLLGTGGYSTILDPLGEREFFYRGRYERIRFEVSDDGEVTGLTWIDRGGKTYPARKLAGTQK